MSSANNIIQVTVYPTPYGVSNGLPGPPGPTGPVGIGFKPLNFEGTVIIDYGSESSVIVDVLSAQNALTIGNTVKVSFPTLSSYLYGIITDYDYNSLSFLQLSGTAIETNGATFGTIILNGLPGDSDGGGGITGPYVSTFNGLTGAVQGVSQVNGATGNITNVALTTGKLSQFALTTSAELAGVISNETGGGGVLVFNSSPSISTSITTATSTFALVNTVATTLNLGGAATTLTMGGTSGTASIRNSTLRLGNTNNTLTTNSGTTNYLILQPYGNLLLQPNTTAAGAGGSLTSMVVTNTVDGAGQVRIAGGDLALGNKATGEFSSEPVNIVFEGATDDGFDTTLTVVDPTANHTITLPNASGTVALTNSVVTLFNGLTGSVTGVTVGGTNVFTALNTFNAGISAAGATFLNTVNLNSNTIYKPTLQYYNEPTLSPSISGNTLSLDLSLAQVFNVSLNAGISAFIITNVPQTSSRAIGFSLFLTANGTAQGISWGSAIKWPSAIPPTLTTTNNKTDILSFTTLDGGTSYFGSVAGQNY